MAFFNKFLKKRKTGEIQENRKPIEQKIDETVGKPGRMVPVRFGAASSIERAHITEKTSAGSTGGKYTFVVSQSSNKNEVARAVKARYGVTVRDVNILSMPGKMRRRGRQIGWRGGVKKAVVTLKEGETITMQ